MDSFVMRIEDSGSLSPTGDLLAFGIALALTLGLAGVLFHENDDGIDEYPFEDWFDILIKSDLMDDDGDGLLTLLNGNITNLTLRGPVIHEHLRITETGNGFDISFLLTEGKVLSAETDHATISPLHSTVVLFEGNQPGKLTIGAVRLSP
jgi:hypothetical protein